MKPSQNTLDKRASRAKQKKDGWVEYRKMMSTVEREIVAVKVDAILKRLRASK